MIFKIIGMMIVFCSLTFIGIYFGSLDDFRINDLREFKKALVILKSEIEYVKMPLSESFIYVSEKVKNPISRVFVDVANEINCFSQNSISQIWEESLLKYTKQTYLKIDDLELLKDFGKCLGFLDKTMQKSNIDLSIAHINEKIETLKVQSIKNKKMYNSLGALSGLLLCVLLY